MANGLTTDSCLRLLILFVTLSLVASDGYRTCNMSGAGPNLIVSGPACDTNDVCNTTVSPNPHGVLPQLPDGTLTTSHEVADDCHFDGVITFGGMLSLRYGDSWFSKSQEMRKSLTILADQINYVLGGIRVGSQRYALNIKWVGDGSKVTQIANTTAHASRAGGGADFLIGPYGSSMTRYAAQQADLDGKIMIAPQAATPSVIASSSLTFGVLPAAIQYARAFGRAVKAAARLCDEKAGLSGLERWDPCSDENRRARCTTGDGNCTQSLKAGFIYEQLTFPEAVCQAGPTAFARLGIDVLRDSGGNPLRAAIPHLIADFENSDHLNSVTLDGAQRNASYLQLVNDIETRLQPLRDAGVTVLVGCTYMSSARALVDALHQMSWAPLAVGVTGAISDENFNILIGSGWWEGEYVIEPVPWHRRYDGSEGNYTRMTGTEFDRRYSEKHHEQEVSYVGASAFAAGAVLANAIEEAGTLDTTAVAAALRSTHLHEWFADFDFDSNGQAQFEMLAIQVAPNENEERVVFGNKPQYDGRDIHFPMPTWLKRECVARSSSGGTRTNDGTQCSGHGVCDDQGVCQCDTDWTGTNCGDYPWYRHPMFYTILGTSLVFLCIISIPICILCHRERARRKALVIFKEIETGMPPSIELPEGHRYMLFLSHIWATGQDQVAVIKRRLQSLVPGCKIFLDVEDLEDIGALEEYIADSTVILIFLSKGYFFSRNCMREVRAAVEMEKPIVLVNEVNQAKGGAPLAQLREECPEDVRDYVFGPPDAPREVIQWRRIQSFQLKALELITEETLHHLPKYEKMAGPPQVFVPGDVQNYDWNCKVPHQLYTSPNNPGAAEMATLLANFVEKGSLTCPSAQQLDTWAKSIKHKIPAKRAAAGSASRVAAAAETGKARTKAKKGGKDDQSTAKQSKARRASLNTKGAKVAMPKRAASKKMDLSVVVPDEGGEEPLADEALDSASHYESAPVFENELTSYFLLYLNRDTFVGAQGDALADEIRYIFGLPGGGRDVGAELGSNPTPCVKVVMMHEQDEGRGACEFDRFLHVTPKDLVIGGLYKPIALSMYAGEQQVISLAEVCKAMGMDKALKKSERGMMIRNSLKRRSIWSKSNNKIGAAPRESV